MRRPNINRQLLKGEYGRWVASFFRAGQCPGKWVGCYKGGEQAGYPEIWWWNPQIVLLWTWPYNRWYESETAPLLGFMGTTSRFMTSRRCFCGNKWSTLEHLHYSYGPWPRKRKKREKGNLLIGLWFNIQSLFPLIANLLIMSQWFKGVWKQCLFVIWGF